MRAWTGLDGCFRARPNRSLSLRNSCISVLMAANLGDASSQTEEFRLRRRHLTLPVGLFNVSRTSRSPGRTRTARPASIKTPWTASFETALEPATIHRPDGQNRILTIDKGRFTLRRARLAPAMISTPGHRASRRRQRGVLPAWSLFGP